MKKISIVVTQQINRVNTNSIDSDGIRNQTSVHLRAVMLTFASLANKEGVGLNSMKGFHIESFHLWSNLSARLAQRAAELSRKVRLDGIGR